MRIYLYFYFIQIMLLFVLFLFIYLFCNTYRFTISIHDTMPQFNDNLMNQFNEEKGYE